MPKRKELPVNPSREVQRDLLIHPESNPTRYIPFEDAEAHPFVPGATSWSRVNAWWLADAAWIAYSHDKRFVCQTFSDRAGLSSCETIADRGTDAYLAHNGRFAIVTFRGTQPDDWNDLFNISCFVPIRWDVGFVHKGFAAALDAVWRPLEDALNTLPVDCRVWFTGHSLGGALASLAAVRTGGRAAGVYTFGSPRVGDAVFAAHLGHRFEEASIRYVNDHDVVTHVPPEPFAFPGRYTHVDRLRWINKDGQVGTTRPTLEHFMLDVFGDPSLFLDIVELSRQRIPVSLPDTLTDHTPLYYALHTWNDLVANE